MKKLYIYTTLAASMLFSIQSANAYDGKIEFTGKITGQTCTINANSTKDFSVNLPTVSTATLQTAGTVAGRTPFTISLTACNPTSGTITTYFEPGTTVDTATGRLNADTGKGHATNVQLELLNADNTPIIVGSTLAASGSKPTDVPQTGVVNLSYAVQYKATGAATEGNVNSRVNYTLIYN